MQFTPNVTPELSSSSCGACQPLETGRYVLNRQGLVGWVVHGICGTLYRRETAGSRAYPIPIKCHDMERPRSVQFKSDTSAINLDGLRYRSNKECSPTRPLKEVPELCQKRLSVARSSAPAASTAAFQRAVAAVTSGLSVMGVQVARHHFWLASRSSSRSPAALALGADSWPEDASSVCMGVSSCRMPDSRRPTRGLPL